MMREWKVKTQGSGLEFMVYTETPSLVDAVHEAVSVCAEHKIL